MPDTIGHAYCFIGQYRTPNRTVTGHDRPDMTIATQIGRSTIGSAMSKMSRPIRDRTVRTLTGQYRTVPDSRAQLTGMLQNPSWDPT